MMDARTDGRMETGRTDVTVEIVGGNRVLDWQMSQNNYYLLFQKYQNIRFLNVGQVA